MVGRVALGAAERMRRSEERKLDRRRGRRIEQVHDEHSAREGIGRHPCGLCAEWRGGASAPRVSVPGWEAIRSVKWLNRIGVVDQPYMAWHESGNNADTVPSGKGLWYRF